MAQSSSHISVLLHEAIEFLGINPEGIYVDGTLGAGGHSLEIAQRLSSDKGRLIGLDLDEAAIEIARERLKEVIDRVDLIHANYKKIDAVLDDLEIECVDGILLDLGFSSMQIDDPARGLSFQGDGELDMRFSKKAPLTAAHILNEYSEAEIRKILSEYGEERFSSRIAKEVVRSRKHSPIKKTSELVQIIADAVPKPAQRKSPHSVHPATRTFQALRIAVNDELGNVRDGIEVAFDRLRVGGRLVVITFHSLEDRIVKHFMKDLTIGCTCPPDLPACVCDHMPSGRLLGQATPSDEEIESNKRARSARLRAIEKL
jgi:16S rRNA (cytosine1402-N4)-methyltransferase